MNTYTFNVGLITDINETGIHCKSYKPVKVKRVHLNTAIDYIHNKYKVEGKRLHVELQAIN
jgi:hypothetical protein